MSVASCAAPTPTHIWTPHEVRIVRFQDDTADTRTYELEFVDERLQAAYTFRPGQFNMLYLPGAGEAAISISSRAAPETPLLHTVRAVGNVTHALTRLRPGDTFGLRGPFGSAWPIDRMRGSDVLFVTGGIGLAPLRPAIYHVLDHRADYGDVTLLYGARTPEGFLYPLEFDDWRSAGIDVQLTVDRATPAWNGYVGVVTLLLDRMSIRRPAQTQVFCCGPEVMMSHTAISAFQRQIPTGNVWISMERNMNCAIGLCGHCQFGPAFICKDGPVLPYEQVASFLTVKGL